MATLKPRCVSFSFSFPRNTFFVIIIVTIIAYLRVTSSIEDVCQKQISPDVMAYYVCLADAKYVFRPNLTNYKLTVDRDITCQNQLYCTMTTPMQCSNCSKNDHRKEYMVDFIGTQPNLSSWWQSETWSTLGQKPETKIVVSLGRRFILMDNLIFTFASQRPKQAILEKSLDNGNTWTPLQYYNQTCRGRFNTTITSPDDVICTTKYSSEYPNVGGQLIFDITKDRFQTYLGPYFNNYDVLYKAFQETNLLEFLTFTDLRLNLLYPATDGQEIGGSNFDKQKYYYAISDISLAAGCDCNRHAKDCILKDGQMVCICEHNTDGFSCERCQPLFNNRPWQKGSFLPIPSGSGNECQACNCNNRASSCDYDSSIGRGKCLNCTNNTQGINCELCTQGFFKNSTLPLNDSAICIACNCEPMGTSDGNMICNEASGQCQCKEFVYGRRCDVCYDELWGLLTNDTSRGTCKPCNCTTRWTVDGKNTCDQNTGQCNCISGVYSRDCSLCADGYFRNSDLSYPRCDPCLCDPGGSNSLNCDKTTNQCPCRNNFVGARCHFAATGFYVPLPDRINLKADNDSRTTCTFQTDLMSPANPFTGRYYYECKAGQVAVFKNILGPIKRQGDVVQTYIPALRYTLNDANPLPHASLVITSVGTSTSFNSSLYNNITSTGCSTSTTTVTFDLYSVPPGVGKAWMNMTGKIDLDSRCMYDAEFKAISLAGTSPFLLDSLVLFPDISQSLAYKLETSDANKAQYAACLERLAAYNSNVSIDQSSFDLCRNFFNSFMAEQTGEALPCECDTVGSVGPNCSALGGGCTCKTNVGDRKCSYCKSGFFGFSNLGCLACDCNPIGSLNPVCDYSSGQCLCKQNVALGGQNSSDPSTPADRQCSRCLAEYYGLLSGSGCQKCNCSRDGSLSMQCSDTGQCICKPTVGGPKCTECLPGYYGFSSDGCKKCNCSIAGSADGRCKDDGQCFCKPNVQGLNCDQCKDGRFDLSQLNPDGCQPCFCSGMSSSTPTCASAAGFQQENITDLDTSDWLSAPDMVDYVLAPSQFTGNKRSSYAQFLTFTYTPNSNFISGRMQDVILESTDGKRISHLTNSQTFSASLAQKISIQFHESQWIDGSGKQPTNSDFNKILSKLSRMMIKQKFFDQYIVSIHYISLVSAISAPDPSSPTVNYVENCTCINNTAGLSCEKCHQGFKRSSNDTTSICQPCDCKYLSADVQMCDEFTGRCLNCPYGSGGWNCQDLFGNVTIQDNVIKCQTGFWGLSTTGCKACSCFLMGSTNQNCDPVTGKCACKPHVDGLSCDRCEDGYVNMTDAGCSECDQCYMLVVDEVKIISGILQNQSDVYQRVTSSTNPDFYDRLKKTENDSFFLKDFNNNFERARDGLNQTLDNITLAYMNLNKFINSTLDVKRTDIDERLQDIESNLKYLENEKNDASLEVLVVNQGLTEMQNILKDMQTLSSTLKSITSYIDNVYSYVYIGSGILNRTVENMENVSMSLNTKIGNLREITSQVLNVDGQLKANISQIELDLDGLNASSQNIRSQTTLAKNSGADLINRTTIVYNVVVNLNLSTSVDMATLNVNLSVAIPNRAASQQLQANDLINQSSSAIARVQNVTQMTTALNAKVDDFLSQVGSMTIRVVGANLTANNALNLSIVTFINASFMKDVMTNFASKADALKSQASVAIQTASGYSTSSRNALSLANNITMSLDPVALVLNQAFFTINASLSICQSFSQSIYTVRDRSSQLKSLSDSLLNDVAMKEQSVITNAMNVGNEDVLKSQREASNQLYSRAVSLKSDSEQLTRNVTAVSQRLAEISTQLSSKIPITTNSLLALLSQCRDTKVKLDGLTQANTIQTLQSISVTNQQWVSGLNSKRQELRTQLDRLKTIVRKLTRM